MIESVSIIEMKQIRSHPTIEVKSHKQTSSFKKLLAIQFILSRNKEIELIESEISE